MGLTNEEAQTFIDFRKKDLEEVADLRDMVLELAGMVKTLTKCVFDFQKNQLQQNKALQIISKNISINSEDHLNLIINDEFPVFYLYHLS